MNMTAFKMLIQREVWEHKAAVIWTPLIVAAVLCLLSIIAAVFVANKASDHMNSFSEVNVSIDDIHLNSTELVKKLEATPPEKRHEAVTALLTVIKMPFDLVLLIVLLLYGIASTFDERKDRSIYFWRSLPVSDLHSVLAKLVTALLVIPSLVLCGAMLVQLVWLLLATFACWFLGTSAWGLVWEPSALPLFWLQQYLTYVKIGLWSLPFIGVLMLAGAATRRPFLWCILPWPVLWIAEEILFDSSHLAHWFGYRLQGVASIMLTPLASLGDSPQPNFSDVPDRLGQWAVLFAYHQFWIGLLVGAIFLSATVYARRRLHDV